MISGPAGRCLLADRHHFAGCLATTGAGEEFSNLTNTIKEKNAGKVTFPLAQVNDALGYMPQSFEINPVGQQGLGFAFGGYLFVQDRKRRDPGPSSSDSEEYLPQSSVWPFGIGFGVFLAFNGLILGLPWTLPGVVLVATSVGGFVRQSRYRA